MKVFKEEQQFRQTWLIILLGFSLIVPIVLITNANQGLKIETDYQYIMKAFLISFQF